MVIVDDVISPVDHVRNLGVHMDHRVTAGLLYFTSTQYIIIPDSAPSTTTKQCWQTSYSRQ